MKFAARVVACLSLAAPATAGVSVSFVEGAPKDLFEIRTSAGCNLQNTRLEIDLSGSDAGLIFDVTASGAGVEVYQPLELVSGKELLRDISKVKDGDTLLRLEIAELNPIQRIAFTIDMDDTAGARGITVSDSEMNGAVVRATNAGGTVVAPFAEGAVAQLSAEACL